MSSFKSLAGAVLAATAFGVIVPMESRATPSLGDNWAYVAEEQEPCVPRLSVSDNVVDNTIRIQVAEGNTCPVSGNLFIFIQDDRPQPLRLKAVYHHHNSWVASIGDAIPGRYRVMGISPTPSGIGDSSYLTSRELGIDQVITIVPVAQALVQTKPVAPPPQVVAPPQQVVTTLDTESKQLLRTNNQLMIWFKLVVWPKIQAFIRAIEGIKTS
jgi:hypothetical protein